MFLLGLVCLVAILATNVYDLEPSKEVGATEALSKVVQQKNTAKARSARASAEWMALNRGEVGTGIVKPSDVARVRADIAQRRLAKADGLLEWEEMGPNNIGGRTRAILFDKDNPNKIIVGGVAGGLWVSTNSGGIWSPLMDSFAKGCIAVSSITQASNGDIYVGTGEGFYFFSGDGTAGIYGSGIYKSTDGGTTWTLCDGTAPPQEPSSTSNDWASVDKLAAHPSNPGIVYAATQGGMFMTKTAGATWERIKDTDGNDITIGSGYDVKAASNGTIHFCVGTRYYRSVSEDTFERIESNNSPDSGGRKVISVSESDPNLIYVGIAGLSAGGTPTPADCIREIVRSTDGGSTWEVIATGSVAFHPGGVGAAQCQASYDFAISAHPHNPDIVFVAGVILWRGIRQASGGWDWQNIDSTFNDPTSINYVHADKHDIAFKPGTADEMYVISDGGVSRSQNASAALPAFEVRNKNYNVTQFYTVSADQDGKVMGGTQDNGSLFLNCSTNSSKTAIEVWGGDGGFSEISNINPNAMFVGNPGGELYRSGNGGEGFGGSLLDCNIDCGEGSECGGDGALDGGGAFVTPFFLWEDSELYHKVKGVRLGPDDQVESISHGGQTFVITKNPAIIAQDADTDYTDMTVALDASQVVIQWDEEKNEARDYGPNDFRYVRSRMYIGDEEGGLWMTLDALNFQTTPFWIRIGDAPGPIRSITSSNDGNTAWAGTTNGSVLRVNNLDKLDVNEIKLNDNDLCNAAGIANFEDFADVITGSQLGTTNRTITGISTHPFNDNKVYVCAGNYNSSNYVFEIDNAGDSDIDDVEVENITGNLPKMPVYDLVVSNPQSKYLVAATEFGIWVGDLTAPAESMWTEENGGDMNPVPVFRLREEGMAKVDPGEFSFCRVIYAGTHGRGGFRTTSLTNPACNQNVVGACNIVFSGIEEIASTDIKVFPNPANDLVNVAFSISEDQELEVSLFSMEGKLVNRIQKFDAFAGENKVGISVGDVPNGNYLVVLRAGDYQASTKVNVSH